MSILLYTGHMYQLMPSVIALGKATTRFEDSRINRLFGIGRTMNKVLNLSLLAPLAVASRDEVEFNELLRRIVCLLQAADVEFGYLYEEELYLGTLEHDEGVIGVFKKHAQKVCDMFKHHNVKRVITVDPHTTNMLRSVYPEMVEGFHLEVQSYLKVLAERKLKALHGLDLDLVVQDSCIYARYENVVDQPRDLLRRAGAGLPHLEFSGRSTYCCGGPVESLFPNQAHTIAKQRLEQLAAVEEHIVTMCPICLVNLREAASSNGTRVADISQHLFGAFCSR